MDDHELERKIYERIPPLAAYSQPGKLITYVAKEILPDFPEYIPMDVIDTLSELLNVDL